MKNTIGLMVEFCMNEARENVREINKIIFSLLFSLVLSSIPFPKPPYKNSSLIGFDLNREYTPVTPYLVEV